MGFWTWLRRLLGWGDFKPPEDDEEDTITSPITSGNETLHVGLYQSADLTERRGKAPEKTVARYLAKALDDLGFDYRIEFGRASVVVPDMHEQSNPAGGAATWWLNGAPKEAADANLLMLDINGGGASFLCDNYGLGPAGNIDSVLPYHETAPTKERKWSNTRACLHEIGHMLCGEHKHDMLEPPSMKYNVTMADVIEKYIQDQGDLRTKESNRGHNGGEN